MKKRQEIEIEDRWNVEALYPDQKEWQSAFNKCVSLQSRLPHWPTLQAFQGTLNQGAEQMRKALDLFMQIDRELSKLYTYAHLRHDEEIGHPEFKNGYEQILAAAHAFNQETSWLQPELLSLPDSLLQEYCASPLLADYYFYLEKMKRIKKHTLSLENENLMALAGQALQTSYKIFSAINDADFKFDPVSDNQGESKALSHATYGLYIRDQDRILRENAFKQYHQRYLSYENTLCEF